VLNPAVLEATSTIVPTLDAAASPSIAAGDSTTTSALAVTALSVELSSVELVHAARARAAVTIAAANVVRRIVFIASPWSHECAIGYRSFHATMAQPSKQVELMKFVHDS
jgi:hypothetical protein